MAIQHCSFCHFDYEAVTRIKKISLKKGHVLQYDSSLIPKIIYGNLWQFHYFILHCEGKEGLMEKMTVWYTVPLPHSLK